MVIVCLDVDVGVLHEEGEVVGSVRNLLHGLLVPLLFEEFILHVGVLHSLVVKLGSYLLQVVGNVVIIGEGSLCLLQYGNVVVIRFSTVVDHSFDGLDSCVDTI